MPTKPETPPPSLADDPDWDSVDQAAWESFPASDPPSFSSGHAAPSRATVDQTSDLVAQQVSTIRRRARIRSALRIGLGALSVVLVWKLARATR